MGGDWGPLNARARGLGSAMLSGAVLRDAAGAASVGDLAGRLGRAGYPPDGADLPATAGGLDRAIGRVAGWRLGLLHRWAGALRSALPVVFEAEDRRSLRAILRGIAEGAAPERRLRGLVPTPALPRRALEELAGADSRSDLAVRLGEIGHPLGEAWAEALGDGPSAGLYEAEAALDRAFADRAVSAARPERGLRRFAARWVDRANAWTLLLADRAGEPDPGELHLPGGRRLPADRFASILSASDREERRRRIGEALEGRAGALFGDTSIPVRALPARLLSVDLREERARARRDPLGPAPFLHTILRSRAEARDLRRAVWGAAMGAPAPAGGPVISP